MSSIAPIIPLTPQGLVDYLRPNPEVEPIVPPEQGSLGDNVLDQHPNQAPDIHNPDLRAQDSNENLVTDEQADELTSWFDLPQVNDTEEESEDSNDQEHANMFAHEVDTTYRHEIKSSLDPKAVDINGHRIGGSEQDRYNLAANIVATEEHRGKSAAQLHKDAERISEVVEHVLSSFGIEPPTISSRVNTETMIATAETKFSHLNTTQMLGKVAAITAERTLEEEVNKSRRNLWEMYNTAESPEAKQAVVGLAIATANHVPSAKTAEQVGAQFLDSV